MMDTIAPEAIAQTIQLSVAPVFLIAGIAAMTNVITQRLGRVSDQRRRVRQALAKMSESPQRTGLLRQLHILDQRLICALLATPGEAQTRDPARNRNGRCASNA